MNQVKLFVLAGTHDKFTEDEFKHLKEYVENGGSIMILLGEGGEIEFNTNLNFLLEEFGMSINSGMFNSNFIQNYKSSLQKNSFMIQMQPFELIIINIFIQKSA